MCRGVLEERSCPESCWSQRVLLRASREAGQEGPRTTKGFPTKSGLPLRIETVEGLKLHDQTHVLKVTEACEG